MKGEFYNKSSTQIIKIAISPSIHDLDTTDLAKNLIQNCLEYYDGTADSNDQVRPFCRVCHPSFTGNNDARFKTAGGKFTKCISNSSKLSVTSSNLNELTIFRILENCNEFNKTTRECMSCRGGYYLSGTGGNNHDAKFCCKLNEVRKSNNMGCQLDTNEQNARCLVRTSGNCTKRAPTAEF